MKRLLPILMVFGVFLGSAGESSALPECPGSYNSNTWTNCFGDYTYANGNKYVGEWKDANPHGQGTYTDANGDKYVGEWKDANPHGQGTFTFADGDKYVGEYKNGKPDGQGTYTYGPNSKWAGDKYVGEYKDDKMHGQGTYTYADGRVKEGIFANNQFKYAQKITPTVTAKKSPTPSSSVNQSALPKCEGSYNFFTWTNCFGTYTYANGNKYVGEFKDGKANGQGTYYFLADNEFKGDKYVGEWKDNKSNGQGTYTNANGGKYVGEFKDGVKHGQGAYTNAYGFVKTGIWENGKFKTAEKVTPTVAAKKSPEPSSQVKKELDELRKKIARLEKEKKQKPKPKQVAKKTPQPTPETATSGSGFFVSKTGHVITNQHVVGDCKRVTVGDNANKQVTANVVETDIRNDLALLKISSMEMASAETKTLVAKLGIKIVPLASQGLLRPDSVELGEDVVVAGFPFGDIFSNTIKITKGVVSAKRGMGNDSGQFQIDAAVQKGSSGGPIYDENGNIIGVVVSQLNKLKVAKAIGSLPENVNFGIKASTVKQFLNLSGLPSSWSKRSKRVSTKDIAKIAENQTVMVMCHR